MFPDFPDPVLMICSECGKEIDEWDDENHYHLCEDCWLKDQDFEKTLTLENAFKYAGNDTAKFEVNEFLSWVYDSEDVENILLRDFKAMPEEKQKDYIRRYAMEGLSPEDWLYEIGRTDKR